MESFVLFDVEFPVAPLVLFGLELSVVEPLSCWRTVSSTVSQAVSSVVCSFFDSGSFADGKLSAFHPAPVSVGVSDGAAFPAVYRADANASSATANSAAVPLLRSMGFAAITSEQSIMKHAAALPHLTTALRILRRFARTETFVMTFFRRSSGGDGYADCNSARSRASSALSSASDGMVSAPWTVGEGISGKSKAGGLGLSACDSPDRSCSSASSAADNGTAGTAVNGTAGTAGFCRLLFFCFFIPPLPFWRILCRKNVASRPSNSWTFRNRKCSHLLRFF